MNVVLAAVLTSTVDPQRGVRWTPSLDLLDTLHRSIVGICPLVVLADDLPVGEHDGMSIQRVDADGRNPYHARWSLFAQWLTDHTDVRRVFIVDATDVEMLHAPFPHMAAGMLYVGGGLPSDTVGGRWLVDNHPSAREFAAANRKRRLLNCGTLGSDRATMLDFLADLNSRLAVAADDLTDMGAFNAVCWSPRWADRIVSGDQVHTEFRANDRTHPIAWFRHK